VVGVLRVFLAVFSGLFLVIAGQAADRIGGFGFDRDVVVLVLAGPLLSGLGLLGALVAGFDFLGLREAGERLGQIGPDDAHVGGIGRIRAVA